MALFLISTTDAVEVVTGTAINLDVHASWADNNAGTLSYGKTATAISTATTTTVVAAPASGVTRNIRGMTLRNKSATASDVTVQIDVSATNYELVKVTLRGGETLEYQEGVGWYVVASAVNTVLMKALAADDTGGQNVNTAQPWFPTAGGVTVEASSSYYFEGTLRTTRAAGATSHTTGMLFGGTATLTGIHYAVKVRTGDADGTASSTNQIFIAVATNTTVKAASTSTTEVSHFEVDGIVRINAAGTFIPQFQYSAAPGGAPTVKAGTFFAMYKINGDNNAVTFGGTWA